MDASQFLEKITNSRMSAYGLTVFAPLISWATNGKAYRRHICGKIAVTAGW